MDESDRYSRQERLPEVGRRGQERIRRFVAVVRGGAGADVARAYLSGAGVGGIAENDEGAPEPFRHADAFRFEAARDVGAGAWRALAELRRALQIGVG